MFPLKTPKRTPAGLLTRCALLVGLLLSLALVFGPPLRTVQAGEVPGETQVPQPLNQSDEHGHTEGDDHTNVTPTPEHAHDDNDGHHAAPSPQATPTSAPVQAPTQRPHDDSDGHHAATPTPAHDNSDGHHRTPVPADDHSSGGSHSDGGHGEGTTDSHGDGGSHSEGEGHGRAVPPPDPTTKKIVLGSLAGFNVLVLIVAAVLKRRMPQRKPRPVRPS